MGKSTDNLNQMIRDSQVAGERFGKMLLGPQYQTEEGFLITREKERNDSSNVLNRRRIGSLSEVLCPQSQLKLDFQQTSSSSLFTFFCNSISVLFQGKLLFTLQMIWDIPIPTNCGVLCGTLYRRWCDIAQGCQYLLVE